jgi:flavin-dependent dehydrogenase
MLLDCSGHSTIIGRHLKTRRSLDPQLHRVAYFEHFDNVERLPGTAAGHPGIIMTKEGWFWIIALDETKTSVGFVTRPELIKQINVAPNRMLAWAAARCPVVRQRMRNARGAAENRVLSDFSYTCAPYAGPGYFMVGDAGCFLDPIFSTGVTLAMMAATDAAKQVLAILQHNASPARARKKYCDFVTGSTSILWRLIKSYYNHSFRELFLNGTGPLRVHNAVIATLAGQVFPRPIFALRWRVGFFHLCVQLQKYFPLVPRRPDFSLLNEQAEMPQSLVSSAEAAAT